MQKSVKNDYFRDCLSVVMFVKLYDYRHVSWGLVAEVRKTKIVLLHVGWFAKIYFRLTRWTRTCPLTSSCRLSSRYFVSLCLHTFVCFVRDSQFKFRAQRHSVFKFRRSVIHIKYNIIKPVQIQVIYQFQIWVFDFLFDVPSWEFWVITSALGIQLLQLCIGGDGCSGENKMR